MSVKSYDTLSALHPIFTLLSPKEQSRVRESVLVEYYNRGDIIYKEGDAVQYMYFLLSGSIKICRESLDGFNSLQLAPLGDFFDISPYFTTKIHGATAEVCSDTKIYAFPIETIEYLLGNNLPVCRYLLSMMATEFETTWQRQVQLKNKQMRGRLADTLLYIASLYGYKTDGYTLGIQLSRNDLSTLSSMSPSNVSRTLTALALERVISLEGKQICIMDRAALQTISEQE